MLEIKSSSPEETQLIGMKIGELIDKGDTILLYGDLGAGKTLISKGIALGADVADHVTSPTYTLINEYEGRIPVYHMDLYRLSGLHEAYDLGLEEYFYGPGVTLVEWPERIEELLPKEYLGIHIVRQEDGSRLLRFEANGQRYQTFLKAIKHRS